MSSFRKAKRTEARARIGISGPAGSGKTMGALILALGLTRDASKIAVVDTEAGSANLYEDVPGKLGFPGTYDVAPLRPPYTVEKALDVLGEAERAGYEAIILDSLTHYWDGEGGLLERKDRVQAKDSYTAWRTITPLHNRFVERLLASPAHILCTMRAKTAYDLEKDDRGKIKPVKIGLKPVVREGLDYEFTLVFDVEREGHIAKASKDRTQLFGEAVWTPQPISLETAERLKGWLEGAAALSEEELEERRREQEETKTGGGEVKDLRSAGDAKRDAFLTGMGKWEAALGSAEYLRILGVHGFTNAAEIIDPKAQRAVLDELKTVWKDRKEKAA